MPSRIRAIKDDAASGGDQPKDREDVIGVIAVNYQTRDRDYLKSWCERLGTTGTLREFWTTATNAT